MGKFFGIGLAVVALGLSCALQAAPIVLFEDSFDTENGGSGALNYSGLTNWNVTDGTVDLIGNGYFDLYPGNGLYLDLDGSTSNAGTLESKTTFVLDPGDYELRFDLGGSTRPAYGPTDTVTVSLGSVFSETFTLNYDDPLAVITRNITIVTGTTGKLVFDHAGGDNVGLILDDVRLTRLDTASVPESPVTLFMLAGLAMLSGVWQRGRSAS